MAKNQTKAAAKPAPTPDVDPAVAAKALEISLLTQEQFDALTEGEQGNYYNAAKAALAVPVETATPPAPAVETVKMVRDAEQYPEGPHAAEVHPDEVDNFKAGGWVVAE